MAEWKTKLDAFLTLNDRDILTHAGSLTTAEGKETAAHEFEKYEAQRRRLESEQPVSDFDMFIEQIKKLPPEPQE